MKTTIELPDALFAQMQQRAKASNTTMKALITDALRKALAEEPEAKPFKLRDGSVSGNGMTAEFQNMTWEEKLEVMYGDRA
ncbi:MAG: hypothetical protein QM601_14540 [Pseudoxanthomonas sp.]